jgi:hypothetical protein
MGCDPQGDSGQFREATAKLKKHYSTPGVLSSINLMNRFSTCSLFLAATQEFLDPSNTLHSLNYVFARRLM